MRLLSTDTVEHKEFRKLPIKKQHAIQRESYKKSRDKIQQFTTRNRFHDKKDTIMGPFTELATTFQGKLPVIDDDYCLYATCHWPWLPWNKDFWFTVSLQNTCFLEYKDNESQAKIETEDFSFHRQTVNSQLTYNSEKTPIQKNSRFQVLCSASIDNMPPAFHTSPQGQNLNQTSLWQLKLHLFLSMK